MAARTTVIGLCLLPAGWARSVRTPAVELADRMVAGDAVWSAASCTMLLDHMRVASEPQMAAAALFRFVASQQVEPHGDCNRRIAATMAWLSRAGSVEVTSLAQALDLSHRQTERFTGRHFGARPKLLELKYRALRLAAVSALGNTRVYDVERSDLLDSFYDQSHLIRNFQRFVGHTPTAFDNQADFARLMLQGRWNGGARTPLTLWS